MQLHKMFFLRTLFATQFFFASVYPAPGWNNIIDHGTNLVVRDDSRKTGSWRSSSVIETTETATVTVGSGTTSTAVQPAVATVTLTTIETACVGASTADPGTINNNSIVTVTVTTTAVFSVNNQSINPANSFRHTNSTSPTFQITNSTMMTAATITSTASSLSSTMSFDDGLCDDIFCNADGNRICIYWAGYTSFDISLGPIPGERPTIIGAC